MAGFGGLVVVSVAKPSKRIWRFVRDLFLGRRCVDCERLEGVTNTEETFKGPRRNGLCQRCNARQLAARPDDETAAGHYEAELIRQGKFVNKKLAQAFREDNVFRRTAAAARKSG